MISGNKELCIKHLLCTRHCARSLGHEPDRYGSCLGGIQAPDRGDTQRNENCPSNDIINYQAEHIMKQDSGHSQGIAWGPVPSRSGTRILTCVETSPWGPSHPQAAPLVMPGGASCLLFICSLPSSSCSFSLGCGLCNWFVIAESKMGVY